MLNVIGIDEEGGMSARARLVQKVQKCLALSASANEHEAQAALRQARKLMDLHAITEADVHAADAEERRAKSSVTSRPATWEASLAARVGDAFGCRVLFTEGIWARRGEWRFVGCGPAPEIAQYAFATLLRQIKLARTEHVRTHLRRCKTATKTRRADLFCQGWIRAVTGLVTAFANTDRQAAAIDAYLAVHYPTLSDLQPRDRNSGRTLRHYEFRDYLAGKSSGRGVILNHAISGMPEQKALQ